MAEHAYEPIHLRAAHLPLGARTHHPSVSNTRLRHLDALRTHLEHPTENPHRCGPQENVPVPRGPSHRQADRDRRYAKLWSFIKRDESLTCSQPCSVSNEGRLQNTLETLFRLLTASSTVSKVLRQKEKYLYQDDGSRSPIKRSKGKFPDIERALANWARNHQKQGLPLTDNIIREKAKFFATTVGNNDSHLKANSTSWLEKFKQKNNLLGSKSRKGSIAEESEGTSNPPSNVHTPGGISPTSPSGVSPSPLSVSAKLSKEELKTESPDIQDFSNHRRPFHSQSSTSLSSVFTDTAPSSFSAGPTSPTSLSSPFFTPDSATGPNPFIGRGQPGSSNFQRPRSQTFPMLVGVEQYMSPPPSSEALTPKFLNSTALDSPMDEFQPSLAAIDDAMQASPTTVTNSMQPPPLPNGVSTAPVSISMQQSGTLQTISEGMLPMSPSQEEAARALELVWTFFQQQHEGFVVEPQEYVTIGKLMEKLKIKRGSESLPSGMRRTSEPNYGTVDKIESVDPLH